MTRDRSRVTFMLVVMVMAGVFGLILDGKRASDARHARVERILDMQREVLEILRQREKAPE